MSAPTMPVERLRLALAAISGTEPQEVLDGLLVGARDVTGADAAWLIRPEAGTTVLVKHADVPVAGTPERRPADPETVALLRASGPVAGRVGEPGSPPVTAPFAGGCWLAAPLALHEPGDAVLLLASGTPGAFGETQVQTIGALVVHGLVVHTNARLRAQLEELAVVDELTGVPTRRRFFELAEREMHDSLLRDRQMFALMIDIDGFDSLKETYGPPVGDQVIREVAARLAASVRPGDVIGRSVGAEFSVLLAGSGADTVPERLRTAVSYAPVQTAVGPLAISVSIGATARLPGDRDVAEVLERADRGLHRGKQNGRDRVELV